MDELQTKPLEAESPNGILNAKKLMKELVARTGIFIPQRGAVLDGEVISISLSSILVDLGPFGTGAVYPGEFYDDPKKQKVLEKGQHVKTVLLDLENEEGLRELSLKRAQMRTAWQEIKEMYEKGEIFSVTVNNLNKGGLIAQVLGLQAFMPLSQLSEEHYPKVENGNVQEIMKILQTYRNKEFRVKIMDMDELQSKLIISEKTAWEAEAKEKAKKYEVGEIVEGKVSEITDFGVFVRLNEGGDALVPKSEIDIPEGQEVKDVLKTASAVKGKIIEVSPDKIVLSLKIQPSAYESRTKQP